MAETLEVYQIPALSDNIIYCLRDTENEVTGVVDPSQADPVLNLLNQKNWKLDWILNTHHHWDHVGGNKRLKEITGCEVMGFEKDQKRIPGIDKTLEEGQRFWLGGALAEVLFIPGHTLGHVAYWFPEEQMLFSGDTLFAMGCGRLFEGKAEQLKASLDQTKELPGETEVYCGHEYTQKNARFALQVEPENEALRRRAEQVNHLRAQEKSTLPSSIEQERKTNPFFRTHEPSIRRQLNLENASDLEVFIELRERRNHF